MPPLKCTTHSGRRTLLLESKLAMNPPLQFPPSSRVSSTNTNVPEFTTRRNIIRIDRHNPRPISLTAQMLRDAVALHSTADDERESLIERPREARLYQEIRPSRSRIDDIDRNTRNRHTSTAYSEPPPAYEDPVVGP